MLVIKSRLHLPVAEIKSGPRHPQRAAVPHRQRQLSSKWRVGKTEHPVRAAAGAGSIGVTVGNGADQPPSGGSGGPPGSGPPPAGGGDRWHPPLGTVLALSATAYVLLGLHQPWRLLCGLTPQDTSAATVSIIIPVLNEAGSILATLQRLRELQPPVAELIVVDGGSTDGTVKLVRDSGLADKVLHSGRGRAVQMNAGAAAAKGDLLCFLHADTQPPHDLVAVMRRELRDPHTVLAGFVPSIKVEGRNLWPMSINNFLSTYYAPLLFRPLSFLRGVRMLFGDQTMFCRACDFKAVGGFDSRWAIMEDADLCVRMHEAGPCYHPHQQQQPQQPQGKAAGNQQQQQEKQQQPQGQGLGLQQWWQQWRQPRGRVRQVCDRVCVTSGRRLDAWGPLKATYIHVFIATSWYFNRDPVQLKQLYDRMYTDLFR